ncbi:MAG: hypothetical protein WCC64_17285, partial [Aliidongia sp.]
MSATLDETQQQEQTFVAAAAATAAQTDASLAVPPDPAPETNEEKAKRIAAGYGLTETEYAVLLKTTCKDAPRE